VAQLCINTLLATKVTLITDGIEFCTLSVKADLQELGYGGMDCIDEAQDRDRWRAIVNEITWLHLYVDLLFDGSFNTSDCHRYFIEQ
jgi:hypothetical protein